MTQCDVLKARAFAYLNGGNNSGDTMEYSDWLRENPGVSAGLTQSWGSDGVVPGAAGSGVSAWDLTAAANGASITPTSAAGAPSMERCTAAKCGATQLSPTELMACSAAYGAQALALCVDPACKPYRGNSCAQPMGPSAVPVPVMTPALQANSSSVQVLTPSSLTAPLPDITAPPAFQVTPGVDAWCSVNSWIADNPLLAAGALLAAFFLTGKKGR